MVNNSSYIRYILLSTLVSSGLYGTAMDSALRIGAYGMISYAAYCLHERAQHRLIHDKATTYFKTESINTASLNAIDNSDLKVHTLDIETVQPATMYSDTSDISFEKGVAAGTVALDMNKIVKFITPATYNIIQQNKVDIKKIKLLDHPVNRDPISFMSTAEKTFFIMINSKADCSMYKIGSIFHEVGHIADIESASNIDTPFSIQCETYISNIKKLFCLYAISSSLLYKQNVFLGSICSILSILYNMRSYKKMSESIAIFEKKRQTLEIAADTLSALKIQNYDNNYQQLSYKIYALEQIFLYMTIKYRTMGCIPKDTIAIHPCFLIRLQKIIQAIKNVKALLFIKAIEKDNDILIRSGSQTISITKDEMNSYLSDYMQNKYVPVLNAINLPEHIQRAIMNNTRIDCCTPYEYVSER